MNILSLKQTIFQRHLILCRLYIFNYHFLSTQELSVPIWHLHKRNSLKIVHLGFDAFRAPLTGVAVNTLFFYKFKSIGTSGFRIFSYVFKNALYRPVQLFHCSRTVDGHHLVQYDFQTA